MDSRHAHTHIYNINLTNPTSAQVDRAHYAPASAYEDSPQSIGYAATISAPHMHAAVSFSLPPLPLPRHAHQPNRPTGLRIPPPLPNTHQPSIRRGLRIRLSNTRPCEPGITYRDGDRSRSHPRASGHGT